MINLCSGWEFAENWSEELLSGGGETVPVRLPHTVKETPLHYAGPQHYEGVYGYRRALDLPESLRGRRLFLQFDGAAHIAEVFFNGVKCAEHRCGYTAFRAEITDYVNFGSDNTICVRLDCTENPAVPPFGFVIDYLTYGGLYREVWLDVRERDYIEDLYVTTPGAGRLEAELTLVGRERPVRLSVWDGGKCLARAPLFHDVVVEGLEIRIGAGPEPEALVVPVAGRGGTAVPRPIVRPRDVRRAERDRHGNDRQPAHHFGANSVRFVE